MCAGALIALVGIAIIATGRSNIYSELIVPIGIFLLYKGRSIEKDMPRVSLEKKRLNLSDMGFLAVLAIVEIAFALGTRFQIEVVVLEVFIWVPISLAIFRMYNKRL